MTSLTRVAIAARKSIRYGIFLIIFLIVGKSVLDVAISVYLRFYPPGPPPPTVKFGPLPQIPFPTNAAQPQFSYILETPEGGLPTNIPTQAKVYFMPKLNPNLLSLDLAKEKARGLNFTGEAQEVSDTIYRFRNTDFPSVLEMNIITGSFSISYDLNADRSPLELRPPIAEVAASNYRATLSSANILPPDLTGPTTHSFYKLSDGRLVSALSLSEADVVKVNFFRKAYDDLPSLTASSDESNVWVIVSGSRNRDQQVIAAEYHYFPIDETQFSTYPIKTPEAAFADLTAGNVYLVDPGTNSEGASVKIRRIYLGYFDPEDPTDFYQPIYVFEGDNGFIAYTAAVTPDYYGP